MFAKRMFFTIFITTVMATVASAQSAEQGSLWKKLLRHRTPTAAIHPPGPPAQEDSNLTIAAASGKGRLEGTWIATVTFPDDSQIQVLFTFMPGKDENEGTLIDTNNFLLTPGPLGAPDQGAWQRVNKFNYIATHLAFLFDSEKDNAPFGTAKVRDTITVNSAGTQFTGTQFIELFDPDGQLLDSVQATMVATRLQAEAPPNQ